MQPVVAPGEGDDDQDAVGRTDGRGGPGGVREPRGQQRTGPDRREGPSEEAAAGDAAGVPGVRLARVVQCEVHQAAWKSGESAVRRIRLGWTAQLSYSALARVT